MKLPWKSTKRNTGVPDKKKTNPKDALGVDRVPLSLISPVAMALEALAMQDGKGKYGAWNFRAEGARASVYADALLRHFYDWFHGAELTSDTGVHHLAAVRACTGILLDAMANGKLVDDRPPSMDVESLFAELNAEAKRINEKNRSVNPRHFTIADSEDENEEAKDEE